MLSGVHNGVTAATFHVLESDRHLGVRREALCARLVDDSSACVRALLDVEFALTALNRCDPYRAPRSCSERHLLVVRRRPSDRKQDDHDNDDDHESVVRQ
jgi:hypothetical protein